MIGEVVAYAASRATSGAVESISRRAVWFVAGGLVLLLGCFFAVLAAFWRLEPIYGPVNTAAGIASVAIAAAILCFVIPGVQQYRQRQRAVEAAKVADPVAETIKAVNVEASEAVDYFGPAKVLATAFMVGIGLAQQLRALRN
jgi:predicted anti-sigma-YlaC factor YlaD